MLVYAVTIFLSAFLLFQVQPLIGRVILPWFGGSAAVWTACLMYFQVSLLVGYLYAHLLNKYLRPKWQAIVHIALLGVSLYLLPIAPSPAWKPASEADPTGRILLLLAATIGLPYLLLSTTGPLLQAWYQRSAGAVPYRLFALSNLGSMLALLSFPVLMEPLLATRGQALVWSSGYVLFAAFCTLAAWRSRTAGRAEISSPSDAPERPRALLQVLWICLAACSSVMLMGVTNHLSQNVAPIPFLWVLPLSIYLLSFILCFESDRFYSRKVFLRLLTLALAAMTVALHLKEGNLPILWLIPAFAFSLFVAAMVCHGELAALKPHPRYLTLFYLMVALGGALGALFVAVAAPRLFHTFLELPLAITGCAVLVAFLLWREWRQTTRGSGPIPIRLVLAAFTLALAGYLMFQDFMDSRQYRLSVRNFYGVLRVRDEPESDESNAIRILVHGTINHGEELLDPAFRHDATSYYGESSGVGRALKAIQARSRVRVGVIGLGAGVLASYCRPGDVFRFYEINPVALVLAQSQFHFLGDCDADKQVLLGDARLTLEQQANPQLDLLAVDAFSSDAIPVHLLTREAFELYFRCMRQTGVLAVHISNKYLDLEPIVARNAQDLNKLAIVIHDSPDLDYLSSSTWVLLSADAHSLSGPLLASPLSQFAKTRPGLRAWTDDYSNLFQILR